MDRFQLLRSTPKTNKRILDLVEYCADNLPGQFKRTIGVGLAPEDGSVELFWGSRVLALFCADPDEYEFVVITEVGPNIREFGKIGDLDELKDKLIKFLETYM